MDDNISKIFEDWENHKLRNNRPFINFTFENIDLSWYDISYVKDSFCNIKKILDIISEDNQNNIILHINDNIETKDYLEQNKFLLDRISNITNKEKGKYYGNCSYKQLLEIVYGSITWEFPYVYKNDEECNNNTLSQHLLIEFPEKKLYFYIYDCRGGILVSGTNNKESLKSIFSKTKDLDLFNEYWYTNMIASIDL